MSIESHSGFGPAKWLVVSKTGHRSSLPVCTPDTTWELIDGLPQSFTLASITDRSAHATVPAIASARDERLQHD
jgi:hypothetical protein